MNWASWSDFFAMGGYAFYVWGSFGMTFAALAGEVALLRMRRRTLWRKDALELEHGTSA